MGARIKMPDALCRLMRSELERAIYEAALSREDEIIAHRYLVEKVAQIDIAVELWYERSTISRRIQKITEAVINAAVRLKFTQI